MQHIGVGGDEQVVLFERQESEVRRVDVLGWPDSFGCGATTEDHIFVTVT